MNVIEYFLELAQIDNVHPNEDDVLRYVKQKLDKLIVSYKQDDFGNIVACIAAEHSDGYIGICGHVDIAAPLGVRKIIQNDTTIKTDGTSLLGGDDKTAVASMLWLAQEISAGRLIPNTNIELIFTVGEEAGMLGAKSLDYSLVQSDDILVFDWLGTVNRIITRAPAYVKIDIEYIGKSAHPAEWQNGVNAGAHLIEVASKLTQGEYQPGVTHNIGKLRYGVARNQIPGQASLEAEVRSFEKDKARSTANEIVATFVDHAKNNNLTCNYAIDCEASSLQIDSTSTLSKRVVQTLKKIDLEPVYEETYGCFDANFFAGKGKQVVVMGAAYYNPHGPEEYVNIKELRQLTEFIRYFCCQ